jgi:hypothetical protein
MSEMVLNRCRKGEEISESMGNGGGVTPIMKYGCEIHPFVFQWRRNEAINVHVWRRKKAMTVNLNVAEK